MVPTMAGRLQTRLFTMLAFALPTMLVVSLLLSPALGLVPALAATVFAWAATLIAGLLLWEPLYHFLMQFRWEKDWPSMFALLEGIPEAVLVWVLLTRFGPGAPLWAFLLLFFSAWLVTFLMVQGPMRVIFLRWRFKGGKLA